MEQRTLRDFLSQSNLELLSDFKMGIQGQNDFGQFMNQVRKMYDEYFEIKKRETFKDPEPIRKQTY